MSELERLLEVVAREYESWESAMYRPETAVVLRKAAAALGELRSVATDAAYSLKLYRTALGECEAWIDLGLIDRLDSALARLSQGDPAKGGGR